MIIIVIHNKNQTKKLFLQTSENSRYVHIGKTRTVARSRPNKPIYNLYADAPSSQYKENNNNKYAKTILNIHIQESRRSCIIQKPNVCLCQMPKVFYRIPSIILCPYLLISHLCLLRLFHLYGQLLAMIFPK